MGILDFLKSTGKKAGDNGKNNAVSVYINVVPDYPCGFGYKTCWYVIKDETPLSIIKKLGLIPIRESNWKEGLDCVYSSQKRLFVSPPLDGYVLVINICPGKEHDIVKKHALLFGEFQFFGTNRIVEYNAWAKFINGEVIHSYCYIGESFEIAWCEGVMTPEEISLGFDKFPTNTNELVSDEFVNNELPDEEDVLSIAKAWGIDPKFESKFYEKGTGFICECNVNTNRL